MAISAGAALCCSSARSEDVRQTEERMLQQIEGFDHNLAELQKIAANQMKLLVRDEKTASTDWQRQQIETQIGSLQLELGDIARKRVKLERAVDKAKAAIEKVGDGKQR